MAIATGFEPPEERYRLYRAERAGLGVNREGLNLARARRRSCRELATKI